MRGEVVLKIARTLAAIFLRTLRFAQPRTREPHDELPTHAENMRGTFAANPALVFMKRIVEPVVQG